MSSLVKKNNYRFVKFLKQNFTLIYQTILEAWQKCYWKRAKLAIFETAKTKLLVRVKFCKVWYFTKQVIFESNENSFRMITLNQSKLETQPHRTEWLTWGLLWPPCWPPLLTSGAIEEGWREKQSKGCRFCLGDKFYSFPCRASCFSLDDLNYRINCTRMIWENRMNSSYFSKSS